MAKKRKKENKPIDITKWIPVMIVLGFAIGFLVCWLTFSHLGGN